MIQIDRRQIYTVEETYIDIKINRNINSFMQKDKMISVYLDRQIEKMQCLWCRPELEFHDRARQSSETDKQFVLPRNTYLSQFLKTD